MINAIVLIVLSVVQGYLFYVCILGLALWMQAVDKKIDAKIDLNYWFMFAACVALFYLQSKIVGDHFAKPEDLRTMAILSAMYSTFASGLSTGFYNLAKEVLKMKKKDKIFLFSVLGIMSLALYPLGCFFIKEFFSLI